VPIVYTGLRPGEKLEEALWEEGAQLEDTAHPEVLKVTERRSLDAEHLGRAVEALANAAVQGDRSGIDLGLRELIPSFSPTARMPSRTNH
jgi:FlaA1/EpsC-like NDP-sugar epimerase